MTEVWKQALIKVVGERLEEQKVPEHFAAEIVEAAEQLQDFFLTPLGRLARLLMRATNSTLGFGTIIMHDGDSAYKAACFFDANGPRCHEEMTLPLSRRRARSMRLASTIELVIAWSRSHDAHPGGVMGWVHQEIDALASHVLQGKPTKS